MLWDSLTDGEGTFHSGVFSTLPPGPDNIEHGYRFDQEQGLDVEDIRVQTMQRMRRLFALVLV